MPVPGATDATTSDDVLRPSDERVDGQREGGETYSVKFLQLGSVACENASLTSIDTVGVEEEFTPSAGFAVKKGGAKRVTFTKEQKNIMAAFL